MSADVKPGRLGRKTIWVFVLELCLVFIGVLSALAVENYRESINDKATEREYLSAFRDALQSDTLNINTELERCFLKLNAAAELLRLTRTEERITAEKFEADIQFILMLIDPVFNLEIYEDLKFSGKMRVLRNAALRNEIIAHYIYLNKMIDQQSLVIPFISYNAAVSDHLDYSQFTFSEPLSQLEIIGNIRKDTVTQRYLCRLTKQMATYRNSLIYSTLPRTLVLLDKVNAEITSLTTGE